MFGAKRRSLLVSNSQLRDEETDGVEVVAEAGVEHEARLFQIRVAFVGSNHHQQLDLPCDADHEFDEEKAAAGANCLLTFFDEAKGHVFCLIC